MRSRDVAERIGDRQDRQSEGQRDSEKPDPDRLGIERPRRRFRSPPKTSQKVPKNSAAILFLKEYIDTSNLNPFPMHRKCRGVEQSGKSCELKLSEFVGLMGDFSLIAFHVDYRERAKLLLYAFDSTLDRLLELKVAVFETVRSDNGYGGQDNRE